MKRLTYFTQYVLFGCALFSAITSFGQAPPTLDWQKTFGGSDDDKLTSIVQTSDGFLLGGMSPSGDGDKNTFLGGQDYWVVKTSTTGTAQWQKTFGSGGHDHLTTIVQTSDGFLLGGYSFDFMNTHGLYDYWIVKINTAGTAQWDKFIGGSEDDKLTSIVQTSDGYLLGGYSSSNDGDKSTSLGGNDYWIVKITTAGTIQWEKSFGGSANDELTSIVQTSDGYLLGGYSSSSDGDKSTSLGGNDYWIVKITTAGTIQWKKTFGGSADDELTSIVQTSDGYLLGGYSSSNDGDKSTSLGGNDYWIVKITTAGTIQWEKSFGGSNSDRLSTMVETSDGYLLGGYSSSSDGDKSTSLGGNDYWIVKITTAGTIQWEKSFGGSNSDRLSTMVETSDGFLLGGGSFSSDGDKTTSQGNEDYWIVKAKLPTSGGVLTHHYDALMDLRSSLSGVNWDAIWPVSQPVDTWEGVVVVNNRVKEINLPSRQLTGNIPASFGNLTDLEKLDLTNNQLSGSIPSELGNLLNLRYLFLSNNQFTRGLPQELGRLINLEYFYAFNNQLIGSIPYSFGRLTKLKELDISRNSLSGTIPASIGKLTSLTYLSLYNNQLYGNLPVSIKNLINLETLYLYNNQLSGVLLPSFFGLTKLKFLDLSDNLFRDIIPPDICNLTFLETFNIRNNYFTKLPNLSCITTITSLDIRDNIFSFDDIIPNLGRPNFSYGPQRDQCKRMDRNLVKGQDYTFEIDIDPDILNNTYNWYNGTSLENTSSVRSHTLSSITEAIQGDWRAEITNPLVSGLTLTCTFGSLGVKSIPASEHNYILTEIPLVETQTGSQVENLTKEEKNAHYDYFDGLSRLSQQVSVEASPAGYDLVQPIDYDPFGRQLKSYLPYVSSSSDGDFIPDAIADQEDFYDPLTSNVDKIALDADPYSERTFDGSPLSRVLTQTGPGEDWRTASRSTTFNYRTNTDSEPGRKWRYNFTTNQVESKSGSGQLRNYPAGELSIIETTDEEGNTVLEYTDKLNRTVQKRILGDGEDLVTFYVYDDFGNLRMTIPPKAWSILQSRYSGTQDILLDETQNNQDVVNDLCYVYDYDERQRLIYQKVPGAQPYTMIYDTRDRLVLTQDGVQASKATKEWTFTKYDYLNRPIMTGIFKSNADRATLISAINSAGAKENPQADAVGYTLDQSFPINASEADLLTITYYDNYDFKTYTGWDAEGLTYDYAPDFVPASEIIDKPVNMPTGSKIKQLDDVLDGNESWFNTVTYYDRKYRVAQTIAENQFSEIDRTSTKYDFSGKVTTSLRTHSSYTITDLQIWQQYKYDHSERLLEVYHKMNPDDLNDPDDPILLASYEYNELGQLVDKKQHSEDDGLSFLQSVDYRYNIRGWLTHINNSALSDDGGATNDDLDDLFGMELLYNEDLLSEQLNYHPTSPMIPYPYFDQILQPVLAGNLDNSSVQPSPFADIKTSLPFHENNLWASTAKEPFLPKSTPLAEKLKNGFNNENPSFSSSSLKKDESVSTETVNHGEMVIGSSLKDTNTDQGITQSAPLPDTDEMAIIMDEMAFNAEDIIYRVNAGGALTSDPDVDWEEDQAADAAYTSGTAQVGTPSPYLTLSAPQYDRTFGATFTGTNNTGYPNSIFSTERFNGQAGTTNNMQWDFPVTNGTYVVNLLFAETYSGAQQPGDRVFDIQVEDQLEEGFDIVAAIGWNTALVKIYAVEVTDGNLDINFIKDIQNPAIKGIEIIASVGDPPVAHAGPDQTLSDDGDGSENVTLDGTASSDADGTITSYAWSENGNPLATGANPTVNLTVGVHTIILTVTDNTNNTDTDEVIITVYPSVSPGEVVYRVNAGGALTVDAEKDWGEDQAADGVNAAGTAQAGTPSPYLNFTGVANQDKTFGATFTGTNNTGYPNSIFSTERFSFIAGTTNNMQWDFPLPNGTYIVNLLFAEIYSGAQQPGDRVFDIQVEDQLEEGFDIVATGGWNTALVKSYAVEVTDGNLDINFIKDVLNPAIKGIEVIASEGALELNTTTFKKQYNGNIAAIKWNTDGIYGSKEKVYAFGYELNRLKHAVYSARSTVGAGNWDADEGDFNVQDIAYDLNGNISKLTRFGKIGELPNTNQIVIDQLSYQYGTSGLANQLIAVSDNAGADAGFKDGAATSAEYVYDENGNLTKDENKNITSITYNYLNLPQLIIFGNGDEIRFVYDAVGNKTSKEVTSQGVTQATYYIGGIQYTDLDINDAVGPQLDFIAHGEGRVKRKEDDSFVYHYDLRDHLGNVRLTYAAQRVTDHYRLTMESELAHYEENELKFGNVTEPIRHEDQAFNATPPGYVTNPNEVAYLNPAADQIIGPAKSLAVRKGDRVTVSVQARYDQSNTGTTLGNNSFLTALVGAFTGVSTFEGPTITAALSAPEVFSSLELLSDEGNGVPFAHLNFMLFDENFNYLDGGFDKVTSAAATQHETLTLDITIPQRGYLFVYVSNESEWDVRTYFDELVIDHEHLDVVQHDDYYPYGLAHTQQERSNKYLYQGKERQFDLGLGWDDFHARQYDAALGRWHVMDPASQFHSPYMAMGNNPVNIVDPDGEFAFVPIIIGAALGGYSGYKIGKAQGFTGGDLIFSTVFGATVGAISGGVGSGVAAGVGGSISGAYGGLIGAATGAGVAGGMNGLFMGDLAGTNPLESAWKGFVSGFVGGAIGSYISGGAGAFLGGFSGAATSEALYEGDFESIIKSGLIGGAISFGSYQVQMEMAYNKSARSAFSRKQFRTMSRAAQRSFARGREWGGWLTDDGGIVMDDWKSGTKTSNTPSLKPDNAVARFHTHPNWGKGWTEHHSGGVPLGYPRGDMENTYYIQKVSSYVIGRQNTYLYMPLMYEMNSFTPLKVTNPFLRYPYYIQYLKYY